MKQKILLLLCACLLLTGCGITGGRYVSVKPHRESRKNQHDLRHFTGNDKIGELFSDAGCAHRTPFQKKRHISSQSNSNFCQLNLIEFAIKLI